MTLTQKTISIWTQEVIANIGKYKWMELYIFNSKTLSQTTWQEIHSNSSDWNLVQWGWIWFGWDWRLWKVFFYQVEGCEELHIDKEFEAKILSKMPIVMDEVMECITVQVSRENLKDIPKSCICRKEMYNNITNEKMFFTCRDLNIVLLNPQDHNYITGFINTMYRTCLYPSIKQATKITTRHWLTVYSPTWWREATPLVSWSKK